jgi:N-methylhydantoinase B/oxoprolinase/acetone carboxylase alpha subunit
MTASILSNGRVHGAFGMAGGGAGAVGINRVLRADGQVEELRHIGGRDAAGRRVRDPDPGGGGFGSARLTRRQQGMARAGRAARPGPDHNRWSAIECKTLRAAEVQGDNK